MTKKKSSKIAYQIEADQESIEDEEMLCFAYMSEKDRKVAKATLDYIKIHECNVTNENINYQVHYENADVNQETSLGGRCRKHARYVTGEDGKLYRTYDSGLTTWQRIQFTFGGLPLMCASCGIIVVVLILMCWMMFVTLGNEWGEEHYKRLWARAHPNGTVWNSPSAPVAPYSYEKALTEYRYHDHNNLSTKNRANATDSSKKKANKKTYVDPPLKSLKKICSNIKDDLRFDCYPQKNANEVGCIERGCCWRAPNSSESSVPYCFYPPTYETFHFLNMTENKHGMQVFYEKVRPSGYPNDFEIVSIAFKYMSNDVLQVKISDAENKRFEPPYPEIPMVPEPINKLNYRVILNSTSIGFKIMRLDDNVTVWDTQNVGGLILSDNFLQLSTILSSNKVYGLGERRSRFLLDNNWKTYTMFNNDMAPVENMNLYGSHPFYLGLEESGKSHGVLLLNSHPIDVVLQPTPALTYRTIGGILNFFIVMGPAPAQVVSQYTALIGRPFMPPYWSLGFHLCKFNYGSLEVTEAVWQKTRDAGIPYDVQWNDLDYMNNSNMFTYDHDKFAGLPKFVDKLHSLGMHYIPLIDPGVSASEVSGAYPPFDRGLALDVFVKNSTAKPFVGKVWNKGSTVWPDFTHPNGTSYWIEMLKSYHDLVKFDGAWTDMNEPSNFLSGSMYGECAPEELPYIPHTIGAEGLKTKTLCMDARHYAGEHFHWHNLYSLTETIATNFALTEIRGKRPFIISRSSFVGLGHHAGHWSGDIASEWHDMEMTIPELLSFSLFGIPMMGADICGFRGNSSPELCKRWMQLGAFYPFSRNHNSDTSTPQDPVSLGEEVVKASRKSLRLRYSLLPYLYTMFWKAHATGETVARPLFFEFPSDVKTHTIDNQFMIGPHLLIAPILKQGMTATKPYLNDKQHWHNIRDGSVVLPNSEVDEDSTVLIRGGGIIIQQEPLLSGPVTTTNTRSQPLQLLAAVPDSGHARGSLYWDDGDTLHSFEEQRYSLIEFVLDTDKPCLHTEISWWGYGVPNLNTIKLFNIRRNVSQIIINGKKCKAPVCKYARNDNNALVINTNVNLEKQFMMKWVYE